ncbi:NADH-quinone oxidoreductase subunit A [Rickettsiales bacterium LUAb2]
MLSELTVFNLANNSFFYNYLPIILFFAISAGLVIGLLLVSYIIVPQNPYDDKDSPYECGFETLSESRNMFNIRFYLVSILFVVFDVEIVFLYPWALTFKNLSNYGFWSMIAFLVVFAIGFVYEFKKGVLEWY